MTWLARRSDPDAVDPPEPAEREHGHAQEGRRPGHCHREPGGRVSGGPVGGGAQLDRDRGGQCRVQAGGQSQAGVRRSLARLVLRRGERGAGIVGVLVH